MSDEQVAGVYARALFDAAGDAGVVAEVGRELGDFVAALAASASLRVVLADPRVDDDAKKRVLAELTRDAQPLTANALLLLLERGRFGLLEPLRVAFDELAGEEAALVTVEVVSATRLTSDSRKRIAARLREVTGRPVELEGRVDPDIIGGLVLRVGDVVVDGSVRARIEQLRRRLATAQVRGDVE